MVAMTTPFKQMLLLTFVLINDSFYGRSNLRRYKITSSPEVREGCQQSWTEDIRETSLCNKDQMKVTGKITGLQYENYIPIVQNF